MNVDQLKIIHITIIVLLSSNYVLAFEPFTSVGLLGAAGAAVYGGWRATKCKMYECCDTTWIAGNLTKLDITLKKNLFGQHIARGVVLSALKAHFRENAKPKKALALSFHGWPGSGKTYVSQLIVDSLYEEGSKSNYVHFFMARTHFTVQREADIYRLHLQDWIRGNVTRCERSLFVFDEVDKLPAGVLDGLKPFLDYHERIDGIDFRKAVFIFLSNTGSKLIVERLLDLWIKGKKRESIELRDFEDLIRKGAFNEAGGFHKSETIESNLIDHYVPFLPLEEGHVRQCIKAEFRQRGVFSPEEDDIREVVKDLTFAPEPHNLFSNSGCKRISPKVGTLIEKRLFDMNMP